MIEKYTKKLKELLGKKVFDEFVKLAAKRCAEILLEFFK